MDKQRARRSASIPVRIGHAAAWAAGLWKQEHLRTLITGAQRFVLCAVLAQGTILGGYMPFGLAMAAALMAPEERVCPRSAVWCAASCCAATDSTAAFTPRQRCWYCA